MKKGEQIKANGWKNNITCLRRPWNLVQNENEFSISSVIPYTPPPLTTELILKPDTLISFWPWMSGLLGWNLKLGSEIVPVVVTEFKVSVGFILKLI